MDISINKLLNKIGAELAEANKAGSEAKIRERVQAMKAICELILDEAPAVQKVETVRVIQPAQQVFVPQSAPQIMPRQERMVMEDDANGESIFDF